MGFVYAGVRKSIFSLFSAAVLLFFSQILCDEKGLIITATGDIYISKRSILSAKTGGKDIRLDGDIVLGNFEGVLSKNPLEQERRRLCLSMPYEAIDVLKAWGFTALTMNNNHVLDYGKSEYYNFRKHLEKDFDIAGYYLNSCSLSVRGIDVRIAAFSFDGNNNVNDIEKCVRQISQFKETIIIVSAHIGGEGPGEDYGKTEYFNNQPRGNPALFSKRCIDAGADIVVAHGPHVIRGAELYKDRIIFYSLGNFMFDYPGSERVKSVPALGIRVVLEYDGVFRRGEILNYTFDKGVLAPDKKKKAFLLIKMKSEKYNSNGSLIFDTEKSYIERKK